LDTTKITTFARREGDRYIVNGARCGISKAGGIGEDSAADPHHEVRGRRPQDRWGSPCSLTDLDRSKVDIKPIAKIGPKRGHLQ